MKNLIKGFVVALILNVSVVLGQSNIKISVDFPGTAKVSGDASGSLDSKMGFAVGGEFMKPMGNNFAVGGGAQYQLPRGLEAGSDKFNFIPLYAVATAFPEYGNGAYGKITLGYNFHMGNSNYKDDFDLSGGLCYGLGAGYILNKKIFVEAMYSVNVGGFEARNFSADITYSRFTVGVGILLGMGN